MVTPLAGTQALGAPLFGSFGLMTPEQLALQQQQSQQAQLTDLINNSQSGAGAATGFHLRNLIQGAVDKHYGRVDPQEQAAGQNQHILDIIQQASGGDPDKALEIAAKIGIPQAVEMYQKKQLQDAQLANQQNEVTNRNADNTRADAAEQRAQATADMAAKKEAWTTVKQTPDYILQVNGLGDQKAVPLKNQSTVVSLATSDPKSYDSAIDAYGKYSVPLPTSGGRGPAGAAAQQKLISDIKAKYPQWSSAGFATVKAFMNGPDAVQLQSQDAATRHLLLYKQAADAYKQGDFQAFNRLAVALGTQAGSDLPTTLQTIAGIVAPELVKAIVPGGGGVGERLSKEKQFAAQLSDRQKLGNIGAYQQLMYEQRQAKLDKFLSGAPGLTTADFENQFATPPGLQGLHDPLKAEGAGAYTSEQLATMKKYGIKP